MRAPGIEPGQRAWKAESTGEYAIQTNNTFLTVNIETVDKYFALREVNGVSEKWLSKLKHWVIEYLEAVDYQISEVKTLDYIKDLKKNLSVNFYRKKVYQIKRFLDYIGVSWEHHIKPPQEKPIGLPKIIKSQDIEDCINYFDNHEHELQCKALIMLGSSSGARAEELYSLELKDFDMNERSVKILHMPSQGKTTKTGISRIVFFNEECKKVLEEYFRYYNNGCNLKKLWSQTHIERQFKDAPLKVKDLRKYFSSEWERRNGNHQLKERLLGHSLKSVDARHYSYLDKEEIKKVYDMVMN